MGKGRVFQVGLVLALLVGTGYAWGQAPLLGGEVKNAANQDQLPNPVVEEQIEVRDALRDAKEQDLVLKAAREYLFRRSLTKNAAGSTQGKKLDLADAKTGLSLDAVQALEEMAKDDTLVTEDEFGAIGPGRRERLARIAGLTAEQAKQLWPLDDPSPVKGSDLARAAKIFQAGFDTHAAAGKDKDNAPMNEGETQEDANARLAPTGREKAQAAKNTVLTDAEASFAVYAALGFPFPIRVGRINTPPPNGFILFNPQLLRVDLANDVFRPRQITYRWMEGTQEVYQGTAEVMTYIHLPRPTAPVTHVMVSSDDDVMAYALIGRTPPTGVAEVRQTLMKEVVDMHSFLRPIVKLYGLRWSLMPGINNIMDNPQTKAKLAYVMEDLGFIRAGQPLPRFGNTAPAGQGSDEEAP